MSLSSSEMSRFVSRLEYLILASLISCALPPKEQAEQLFVSQQDINVVSLYREGLAFYAKGRYCDAEFKFREALVIAPNADNILFNLANSLVKQGIFDEAEKILKNLYVLQFDETKCLSALALLFFEKKDFDQSLKYYRQAFNVALEWKEFQLASQFARNISVISFMLGREQDALCYADTAFSLVESESEACKFYRLLIALGNVDEVNQSLLRFINDNEIKNNVCLLQVMAMSYLANQDYANADKFNKMVFNVKNIDPKDLDISKIIQAIVYKSNRVSSDALTEVNESDDVLPKVNDKSMLYCPLVMMPDIVENNSLE